MYRIELFLSSRKKVVFTYEVIDQKEHDDWNLMARNIKNAGEILVKETNGKKTYVFSDLIEYLTIEAQ